MPSADARDYERAREAQREREKGEGKGVLGALRDMFTGGSKSGMSAGARARPDVVKTGSGKDTRFMDTRTGQSYAAPSYGAFSFRGLTSNDPANVARNRYGREALDAMRAARDAQDRPSLSDRGIGSLFRKPTEPAAPPPPTAAQLAAIGAPTTPMAPTFVEPPVYGMPGETPAINYGTAFMGDMSQPQLPPINWLDIFGAYPGFGVR